VLDAGAFILLPVDERLRREAGELLAKTSTADCVLLKPMAPAAVTFFARSAYDCLCGRP
jgi:hypothetical protein